MKHYPALDGFRCFALLLVMISHFGYCGFGWIGVSMFFVLSGFLITGILLESKEKSSKKFFRNFYVRRALRIFPAYYLYLILLSVLLLLAGKRSLIAPYLFSLITYIFNLTSMILPDSNINLTISNFWSLCIEEHFYLIWPLIIYYFRRKQLIVIIGVICVLSPIIRYFICEVMTALNYKPIDAGRGVYFFTLSHFDAMALGAAIKVFNLEKRVRLPFACLTAVILIALLLGMVSERASGMSLRDTLWSLGYPFASIANYKHVWSYTVISIVSVFLIISLVTACQSRGASFLQKLFQKSFFMYVGRISYGAYIWHGLVIVVMQKIISYEKYSLKGFICFLFYVALTLILADLSYRLFEKQFLKYKSRFAD